MKTSSEGIHKFLPYLFMNDTVKPWNSKQQLHMRLADDRYYLFLEDLFDNKRNRQYEPWFNLFESLYYDLW